MVQGPLVRGSPYLQAMFIVVVFALAGWPVWRLTRSVAADATVVSSAADAPMAGTPLGKPVPLEVEAVFAPAPAEFQIKNLDQTVLTGQGPRARFTTHWAAVVPAEGVDLVVQAHWPTSATGDEPEGRGPSAARITVHFPDGRRVEKSFWAAADGTLAEVFTVPGEAEPAAP